MILAFTGVLGNFFVCFAVFRTKMMRNSTNILIANLAFADLLQSLNMFLIAVTLFSGKWYFGDVGCQLSGFVMMSMIFASMYILALISLNRYCTVNAQKCRYNLFTVKKTGIVLLVVWIFALVISSPPLYGYSWAAYILYQSRAICSLRFHDHSVYFITYSAILMVPVSMIAYFYCKIFTTLRKSRRKIHTFTQRDDRKMRYRNSGRSNSQISIKIVVNERDKDEFCLQEKGNGRSSPEGAKNASASSSITSVNFMLFIIVIIFLVVYAPTFILNIINIVNPDYVPNVWMDMSFIMLALANHSINPLVYGLMNKQYRVIFKYYCFHC